MAGNSSNRRRIAEAALPKSRSIDLKDHGVKDPVRKTAGFSALPVIVTLFGWASLIKGMLLLVLSPETESRVFIVGLRYERHPNLYATFLLLVGAYLTCEGFSSVTLCNPLNLKIAARAVSAWTGPCRRYKKSH